ncbi:MAG: ADP-ribosylglycohydrolase family protein [Kiritimatiellaeota bacterium]|nr:ADP-ribosylglycohydrolase family protein [Kiritimatiellota bacterium]
MNTLNRAEYRNKVLGCWLGKNVGGTFGAPFEWMRQVNDVSFYVQKDLNGTPLPNDDLDIQLLWLVALEDNLTVTSHRLAEYWVSNVTPHWAEYGIGKTNMRQGLPPPISGTYKNAFKNSCGSYIRSEIWACIAPGNPVRAAQYAYEDAILDHGNGEGVYAEVFMSALESMAFVVNDLRTCIMTALTFIPAECGVAAAVATTLECLDAKKSWKETREIVLERHRGRLAPWFHVSKEDCAKGFDTGTLGYDVPSNIALTLTGLLWGGKDFGEVQCICVNCGEDTDCTGATAGSVWGILYGADAIPQKWLDPIGRGIRTICLNIGDFGWRIPKTVDNLTDRTLRIAEALQLLSADVPVALADAPSSLEVSALTQLYARKDSGRAIWGGFAGPRYDFDLATVHVDYGEDGAVIRANVPKTIRLRFTNTQSAQLNLNLRWYTPDACAVTPGKETFLMLLSTGLSDDPCVAEFAFTLPTLPQPMIRAVLEVTVPGRPTVMLVPVMFIAAND